MVLQVHTDNEFECDRENLRPTHFNIVATNQYAGAIVRSNRTIQDITRCLIQHLPYNHYAREMIIGCITYDIKLLNSLPAENDLPPDLSL